MTAVYQPFKRIDVDRVRDEVSSERGARSIIERYGLEVRQRSSRWLRLRECPRCHYVSSSLAIGIRVDGEAWVHHSSARECRGDMFDLIGACEGFDARKDFRRALKIAMEMILIDGEVDDDERIARENERRKRREDAARAERQRIEAAQISAGNEWARLKREWWKKPRAYVESRRLDARKLIEHGYLLLDQDGNACVPLFGFDGELVNIARRFARPRDPSRKVTCMKDCPHSGGAYLGRLQEIQHGTTAVLTEGIFDSLTAAQIWPERVILGASGKGQLATIARHAAPLILEHGGRLVLVPQNDASGGGQDAMVRAGRAAQEAGLVLDRHLFVLDITPHKDLSDAHCHGWRP